MSFKIEESPATMERGVQPYEVFFTSASALCCRIREIDGKSVGGRAPELIKRIQDAAWAEALSEVEALKAAVSR